MKSLGVKRHDMEAMFVTCDSDGRAATLLKSLKSRV